MTTCAIGGFSLFEAIFSPYHCICTFLRQLKRLSASLALRAERLAVVRAWSEAHWAASHRVSLSHKTPHHSSSELVGSRSRTAAYWLKTHCWLVVVLKSDRVAGARGEDFRSLSLILRSNISAKQFQAQSRGERQRGNCSERGSTL